MPAFPYHFFDQFVFRSPQYSFREFRKLFDTDSISNEKLNEIWDSSVFKEAIYLASPNLFHEFFKFFSSELTDFNDNLSLKQSFLKYFIRMSTRCTPFGLFSGVGLGRFEKANIGNTLSEKTFLRSTKLDMHFLVALSDYLLSVEDIKNRILFFPNNTIYKIGKRIRYIEYENDFGKREYTVSSAPLTEELDYILRNSKKGKTISQIAELLVNDEISDKESSSFIEELIENQVLVSELEPNVSGQDFLETISSVLNKIGSLEDIKILTSVVDSLKSIDRQIGNSVSDYKEIEKAIRFFPFDFDRKYLFQTDLYFENKVKLPVILKKELKKGVCLLNKISLKNVDTNFEKFKRNFLERYEQREVPLALVLDSELGIGYGQNTSSMGLSPYLDDLKLFNTKEKPYFDFTLNSFQVFLNQKLQERQFKNNTIRLRDEDLIGYNESWQDLPDTISMMTQIISENQEEKLFLKGVGGNAGKLFGRFHCEKSEVHDLTKKVTEWEIQNSKKILAEIIHLPHSRIGNVIRRPTIRNYEIPYLAQSILSSNQQILVSDLLISLKNDKIILCSKSLQKEVIPYLTNAHNYSGNALPVYHFLCDYHKQNGRASLFFDWGALNRIYNFLPRVEYENIILSKAKWRITKKELTHFYENNYCEQELIKSFSNWRRKRNIPSWVQWVKYDHVLTLNLENYDLLKLFLDTLYKEQSIFIEEYLYNENCDYSYEFIFPMYKSNNINP